MVADAPEAEAPEISYEQLGDFLLSPASAEMPPDQLLAMVRNAHLKKSKGGGKGGGKDRRFGSVMNATTSGQIAP